MPSDPAGDAAVAPTAVAEPSAGIASDSTVRLDDALAAARPSEPVARLLAEARVAAALFGAPPAGALGRFRILERIGTGGMGAVYAAYDTQLDRAVAVKLVRVSADRQHTALAEAKALARLSHPNVVPVYDVGMEAERVFIVMELVRGATLRRWIADRRRAEVVAAYRQAGNGLAAAHAAGLVHRDFKPDNAIMGLDGRVRVVDLGLACEAEPDVASSEGRAVIAGTPRYMAPEQARGDAVTPAADQYSFCQALAEALGEIEAGAPVPRWLAAVIERGLAAAPGERFASMSELLDALGRDPARIRRRRAVLATLCVLGVAGFVAGRASLGASDDEVCAGGAGELAAVWPPVMRGAALERIAGLGSYGRDVAARVRGAVDVHASRWTAEHRAACLAQRRGTQSSTLIDLRMACLARSRAGLASVAEQATTAIEPALSGLVQAVGELSDPALCGEPDRLVGDIAPPPAALAAQVAELRNQLERARIEIAGGRYAGAGALAHRVADQARSLGYRPLLAEALLVGGTALTMEQRSDAVAPLQEAAMIGFELGARAIAIEAWARLAWVRGIVAADPRALDGENVVEAVARGAPAPRFARALLYNNIASIDDAQGRHDQARAGFERALAEARGVSGPGAAELTAIRSNLADTLDDPEQRDRQLREQVAERTRLLGELHPRTLRSRWNYAGHMIDAAAAARELSAVCDGYEQHADLAELTAQCWDEAAFLLGETGDAAGAIAALERSVAAGRDGRIAPTAAPTLALLRGDLGHAIAAFEAGIAARSGDDQPWWQRFHRGGLALGLALARRASGDLPAARRAFELAEADFVAINRTNPSPSIEHRLARARAELALVLAATGADRARAAAEARAALAWLRRSGAMTAHVPALERLAAP